MISRLVQGEGRYLPVVRELYPHSPSSLKLGARCEVAWDYRYHHGLTERRVTWAAIECGDVLPLPGERSPAYGTEMHAVLEHHVLGEATPAEWLTDPGLAAEAVSHYLPEDLSDARTEVVLSMVREEAGIVEAIRQHVTIRDERGVSLITFNGFVDLVATWSDADAARTGIPAGQYIVDYKSSSDPKRWALRGDALKQDLAACVYRVAATWKQDPKLLWLYCKTRGAPAVYPQIAQLNYLDALERVLAEVPLARRLEAILAGEVIPTPNTEACGDYGGCAYAASAGGPCTAKPNNKNLFARAINAHAESKTITKGKKMAIKGLAQRAAAQAAEAELPTNDSDAGGDEGGEASDGIEVDVVDSVDELAAARGLATAAPAQTRRPRPAARGKAPRATPTGALAEALEDAQIKLAEVTLAEAALDNAREALTAALAQVQKASVA